MYDSDHDKPLENRRYYSYTGLLSSLVAVLGIFYLINKINFKIIASTRFRLTKIDGIQFIFPVILPIDN